MYEIFEQKIQYNLRSQTYFKIGSANAINYGLRAFRYLGPKK